MRNTCRSLLIRILAEVDQDIAKVEDPLHEPIDSCQVLRAVARFSELCEMRTLLEQRLWESEHPIAEVVAETATEKAAATSEQLWDALDRIYNEDGTADRVNPAVIAKLIEFKMVTLDKAGLPLITGYGQNCYVIFESGDDVTTEIDDVAALENRTQQIVGPMASS